MVPHTNKFSTGRRFHKQSHIKSRNGCSSCKDRRVKCDEIHPTCSNCQRRGDKCEYIAPGPIFKKRKKPSRTFVIPYSTDNEDQSFISPPPSSSSEQSPSLEGICGNVSKNYDDETRLSKSVLLDPLLTDNLNYRLGASQTLYQVENRLTLKSALIPRPILSSYMDYSVLNSKVFAYYESIFIRKISKNPIVLRSWAFLTAKANSFPYIYHISMAVALFSLFYDSLALSEKNEKEPVLMLESPLMYKELGMQHYQQFLKCYDIDNVAQPKDMVEFFTHMAASTLHLLFHVLSPCGSVCDPLFYEISRSGTLIYQDSIRFIALTEKEMDAGDDAYSVFSGEGKIPNNLNHISVKKSVYQTTKTCLDMSYYTAFSTPLVDKNIWLFFPLYLYLITDQQPFEDWKTFHTNCKPGPEYLRQSIDILKKEYLLVFNDQQPEKDAIRVLLRWPTLVSERFYTLLGQQDHRCLIIVAHFIMLLLSLNFDGLISRAKLTGELFNIHSVLDDNWKPWVHLPMRCLGIDVCV